ncbi:MAG TPA: hypothetical protein VHA52_07445 [Candidatus Babeliaceae bacterium]|nr:hypothetical protein [Candidatus Babeliaceae bacterium]
MSSRVSSLTSGNVTPPLPPSSLWGHRVITVLKYTLFLAGGGLLCLYVLKRCWLSFSNNASTQNNIFEQHPKTPPYFKNIRINPLDVSAPPGIRSSHTHQGPYIVEKCLRILLTSKEMKVETPLYSCQGCVTIQNESSYPNTLILKLTPEEKDEPVAHVEIQVKEGYKWQFSKEYLLDKVKEQVSINASEKLKIVSIERHYFVPPSS